MRVNQLLLATLLVLPTAALAQEAGATTEVRLLILAGGTKPEEAAKAKAQWEAQVKEKQLPWQAAPGFPQVIDSSTIEGLKPGFHVVVLGACNSDPGLPLLELARRGTPGAYFRTVKWKGTAPCPTLAPSWKTKMVGPVKTAEGELRGHIFFIDEHHPDSGVLEALDATGSLLEFRAPDVVGVKDFIDNPEGMGCFFDGMTVTAKELDMGYSCAEMGCTTQAYQRAYQRFSLAKGKLKERWVKGEFIPGQCD